MAASDPAGMSRYGDFTYYVNAQIQKDKSDGLSPQDIIARRFDPTAGNKTFLGLSVPYGATKEGIQTLMANLTGRLQPNLPAGGLQPAAKSPIDSSLPQADRLAAIHKLLGH